MTGSQQPGLTPKGFIFVLLPRDTFKSVPQAEFHINGVIFMAFSQAVNLRKKRLFLFGKCNNT